MLVYCDLTGKFLYVFFSKCIFIKNNLSCVFIILCDTIKIIL